MAARESEVRSRLGVWNSRNRDDDRHSLLLGRAQQDGPRAASRPRLLKRNFQQGRSSHARSHCNGVCFHFSFLGALGNEQRSRVDIAGRENGSALDGHESDRRPSSDGKSDPDFTFHSVG